jgi:hypothetical protein
MTRLSESAVLAGEILRKWSSLVEAYPAEPGFAAGCADGDSREEERLEALEAVVAELRRENVSRDHTAACRFLLRHLSRMPGSVS